MSQSNTANNKNNVVSLDQGKRMNNGSLGKLNALVVEELDQLMSKALSECDDALFDFTNKTMDGMEQQNYFDALRELRRKRTDMITESKTKVLDGFVALKSGQSRSAPVEKASDDDLALVENDMLELQLASEQFDNAVQAEVGVLLDHVHDMFAQVCGQKKLEPEDIPISPAYVGFSLKAGLKLADIDTKSKLLVFKHFERQMLLDGQSFYESCYELMKRAGFKSRIKADLPKIRSTPSAPKPAKAQSVQQAMAQGMQQLEAPTETEQQLLKTFNQLLSLHREMLQASNRGFKSFTPQPGMDALELNQTLDALATLNNEYTDEFLNSISNPEASLSYELKKTMMNAAKQLGLAENGAGISNSDEDAIDLVGMLFEVLLAERNFEMRTRKTLSRLIVPYTRAALIDRRMFMKKTHPARRLLNVLAEASEGSRGETPLEQELEGRVQETVDRLVADFNEDLAIFEMLEREFREFLDSHQRRVDVSEKRAAEVQRGRERLEQSRALASMELGLLVGDEEAPPVIDRFMRHYWAHHLSVTSLRCAKNPDAFTQARSIGQAVWNAYLSAKKGTVPPEGFCAVAEPVLQSSGLVGKAAKDVVQTLHEVLVAVAEGNNEVISDPNEERMPEQALMAVKLPEVKNSEHLPGELKNNDRDDPIEYEQADLKAIESLEVGTWIELTDERGITQPAKLSWVSPISKRMLFVNRRGHRICAVSAEELASLMKSGKMGVRMIDTAFERAMGQVLGDLKESVEQTKQDTESA